MGSFASLSLYILLPVIHWTCAPPPGPPKWSLCTTKPCCAPWCTWGGGQFFSILHLCLNCCSTVFICILMKVVYKPIFMGALSLYWKAHKLKVFFFVNCTCCLVPSCTCTFYCTPANLPLFTKLCISRKSALRPTSEKIGHVMLKGPWRP